jgi:hypothetical protein
MTTLSDTGMLRPGDAGYDEARVLENAGAPAAVRGFGRLFDDRQPDGNETKER